MATRSCVGHDRRIISTTFFAIGTTLRVATKDAHGTTSASSKLRCCNRHCTQIGDKSCIRHDKRIIEITLFAIGTALRLATRAAYDTTSALLRLRCSQSATALRLATRAAYDTTSALLRLRCSQSALHSDWRQELHTKREAHQATVPRNAEACHNPAGL